MARGRAPDAPVGGETLGARVGGDGLERGATKYLAITPGILLHKRKDRLWQGFIPEHFPRITLR